MILNEVFLRHFLIFSSPLAETPEFYLPATTETYSPSDVNMPT